jgi:hypothetical protein
MRSHADAFVEGFVLPTPAQITLQHYERMGVWWEQRVGHTCQAQHTRIHVLWAVFRGMAGVVCASQCSFVFSPGYTEIQGPGMSSLVCLVARHAADVVYLCGRRHAGHADLGAWRTLHVLL